MSDLTPSRSPSSASPSANVTRSTCSRTQPGQQGSRDEPGSMSRSAGSRDKVKAEPRDDIKNFAEDTMNELLGWYGYERAGSTPVGGVDREIDRSHSNGGGASEESDRDRPLEPTNQNRRHSHKADINQTSKGGASREIDRQREGSHDRAESSSSPHDNDSLRRLSNGRDESSASEAEEKEEGQAHSDREEADRQSVRPDTVTECSERGFVLCEWCERGATLDRHFVVTSSTNNHDLSDSRKFCSEQCFAQSRRHKYKKQKQCEWCRGHCNGATGVEFQDGGETLLFCSETCLNKYKMNIFCQETREHMKRVAAATASEEMETSTHTKQSSSSGGNSTGSESQTTTRAARILITPELWTNDDSRSRSPLSWPLPKDMSDKRGSNDSRTGFLQDKPWNKNSIFPGLSGLVPTSECTSNTSVLKVAALKAKAEMEHPRSARYTTAKRPPRMTDREKIKQIRMRARLPLHTPLRETYRAHSNSSDTFPTSSGPLHIKRDMSSPTPSIEPPTSGFLTNHNEALPLMGSNSAAGLSQISQMSPLSASHLFGVLAATQAGLRPPAIDRSDSPARAFQKKLSRDTLPTSRDESVSCSPASSVSPHMSSGDTGRPLTADNPNPAAPPLYPPPNPFTHMFPSYLPNGLPPFPVPHGLASFPALGAAMYPPPMLPTMHGVLPPNTLMVPYPFLLPLPIPIPIPIPIPQKLIDKYSKDKSKDTAAATHDSKDSKEGLLQCTGCRNGCLNQPHEGARGRLSCATCRCDSRRPSISTGISNNSRSPHAPARYVLSTHARESARANNASIVANEHYIDRAIDLSASAVGSEHGQLLASSRKRSASPVIAPAPVSNIPLIIQPLSDPPVRESSPYAIAAHPLLTGCASERYSARRSLILDAPSSGILRDPVRSPSPASNPDKRSYSGPSVREILYGKRKCTARARIKTK